jgi:Ca2+-binding RTX toxin-like protein
MPGIMGTSGNDTFNEATGYDSYRYTGLGGNDVYYLRCFRTTVYPPYGSPYEQNRTDIAVEKPGEGNDTAYLINHYGGLIVGYASAQELANVEVIIGVEVIRDGVASGWSIEADSTNNVMRTFGGADLLDGGGGNDIINAGDGDDTVKGGDGNDLLYGGNGADSLDGGNGTDYACYDDADYGNLTIRLDLPGQNTGPAAGDSYTNIEGIVAGSRSDLVVGDAGANYLNGGGGNDLLFGQAGNDFILGGAGIDRLDGGTGADHMAGGAGNDAYTVDNLNDIVDETLAGSSGTDSVISSITWSLADAIHTKGDVEVLQLAGSANINATGNSFANVLVGNSGNNILDGRAGADFMQGRGGNDSYVVDNANDVVDESVAGSSGTDSVISSITWSLTDTNHTKGFVEVLQLTGSANVNAYGNSLANILVGNAGNNLLSGAAGNDLLIGGAGHDTFYFNTLPNSTSNMDTISDFSVADDTIWLENAVYAALGAAGPLAAAAFHVGSAAADASDRIVYDSSTGAISYDDDGSGAHAAVVFAKVAAGLALTAADFTVT